jgi:HD superfamily phosphodiesterase
MSNIIEEATEFAKKEYAKHDPMHQWDHVVQVMEIADYLTSCRADEVDTEILKLAVILHDVSYDEYESHVDDSVKVAWDFLTSK